MAIDFDEVDRQIEADRRAPRPALLAGSRRAGELEELSLVQQAGDVLVAPLRGLEGAAQDLYGLADAIAFDALPDYEERLFGVSRTAVGGLIEGVTNFAAGFVGANYVLPARLFARAGRFASVARAAAKGALADFAVFDGNEARLSNLIQEFPLLQGPVTEFLAADPNDPEIYGRLKNSLEGLGVGAFTDAAALGLKALGIGRRARAAGLGPRQVEEAMDQGVPEAQLSAAWKKATEQDPGKGVPGELGSPSRPEAAEATAAAAQPVKPVEARRAPATEADGVSALLTMGMDEAKARELYTRVRQREAPISVDLQGLPPQDPRVNPRKLSTAERLEQELNLTDLNLEKYRGPEGALQLVRAMANVFEPLAKRGEVEYRSLKDIEATAIKQVTDITTQDPHAYLVTLQQRRASIAEIRANIVSDKMALQSAAADAYRLMQAATAPTAGDKDMLAFVESLRFVHDVQMAVSGIVGEFGRGLGANRVPTRYVADLFDLDEIQAALHDAGGRERALDLAKKFKTLMASEVDPAARAAKAADMARGLAGRRALGVLNEFWYNSLLGRPTTLVAATLSNALTTVYRPLENMLGGVVMGDKDVIVDSVRELIGLAQSAGESWRATVAAMKGDGLLLDPRTAVSDIHDTSRAAIKPETFGVDGESPGGQAISWIGRIIRYPSASLTASDQFFKQLNYRAIARSRILKDVLRANPGKSFNDVAGLVEGQLNKLIHRGQAYGTAQLYHRGVEDAVKRGMTGKAAVDEHARLFVREALQDPEHAKMSAVSDLALERAQEVTFTTPLRPGSLPYRYQEAVRNHPLLRMITPFVRTPTNVLKFAFDRNVNAATGVAQWVASKSFGNLVPGLENSKNKLIMDIMSGSPRRRAEASGRLTMGMATTALILMKAAETDEEGRPLVTGFGPSDREQRRILEESGWQQYSIRIGDGYVSYGRVDPFATMIGLAADAVNHVRMANAEDQDAVENISLGFAVAIAHNLTNKTYLSGLANFVDMLSDPQTKFSVWSRTLAASVVPGQAAAVVQVVDPLMRDVQSIMNAARNRWPGASDNLPPLRNVLGEPVKRAQSLGAGISPITNAFVPILYREVSDDLVRTGLAELHHGFTPPKRVRGGLDLSTVVKGDRNAYDRWLELHGEVKVGGRSLKQSLRRLMTSAEYTRIPAQSTDELASPRIGMVQNVIDDYRAQAYRQLTREFPELAAADRARFQMRLKLRRGEESRPALLRALQGNR